MTKTSWSVTLTPLIVAILTLVRAFYEGRNPTSEEVAIFIGAIIAFVGSGYVGMAASVSKKALKG